MKRNSLTKETTALKTQMVARARRHDLSDRSTANR